MKKTSQGTDKKSATRQAPRDRQAAFDVWLIQHGLRKKDLAERLGVSSSMIAKIIKKERAPRDKIALLIVEFGIPVELLLRPSTRGPGRPRFKK